MAEPKIKKAFATTSGIAVRDVARLRDVRSLRSQEALRNALLRLIEQRPFGKITLREITLEAGVSYPTVFNHYDSKEDLFQDIARSEIIGVLAAFRQDLALPGWRPGAGICSYILERRTLWRTLLTAGANEVMRSEFIKRAREIPHSDPSFDSGFPLDIVSGVIASGIFEITAWWLAQDDGYPAETVSDILETLVIEPALNLPRGYFTGRKPRGEHPAR